MADRRELERCRAVAERCGLSEQEVKSIATSYFEVFARDSGALPFDTPRKIFSRDAFEKYVTVRNIPYIGRLGPVYSRYLKWRANESEQVDMAPRSSYRRRVTQSDIESTAEAILSGMAPPPLRKRKGKEMFERVWLVGQDGKKSARQVIPKKEE